jgi:hypothetical protein
LHRDVALLSDTHLKHHERFNTFIGLTSSGRIGGTAVELRSIPHNNRELALFASIGATGICIPIRKSEMVLAALFKPPGHAWNDADITQLLSFRHKSLLAGDLNA